MEEETLDLQNSIRVDVDELDQPPDYPAPPPPSPPLSIELSFDQVLSGFSIDRLIRQIYSSVRSSNSGSSNIGEAIELADLHATVTSTEEHPMFIVDIRSRRDESDDYEPPLAPTPANWHLMIIIFIYFFGVCVTVVIIVLVVLMFLPDVYECIMHTTSYLPDKKD